MSDKRGLYDKDNWLHGWTGGDMPLNMDILKSVIDTYYLFSKQQTHIYLNKYGYKIPQWDKNAGETMHDLALKALFDCVLMMSSDKYEEQGKTEAYLRTIIERKVIRFINYKIKYQNHDNLESLKLIDENAVLTEKRDAQDFMKDCEEDMRQSNIPHAVNNLNLLLKQKFEEKSVEALALEEQTSVGGIKSRLRLVRQMLRECIENKQRNTFEY
jgi:DNA-directed RNA polymerase specialized sigma24 family protein